MLPARRAGGGLKCLRMMEMRVFGLAGRSLPVREPVRVLHLPSPAGSPMRRFQIPATVALVHAIAMAAVVAFVLADFGRNFPHSPSRVGRAVGGLAYLLGFPLVSGALYLDRFPFFGPAWQPLALLAANSALWGVAAALVRRRAHGAARA